MQIDSWLTEMDGGVLGRIDTGSKIHEHFKFEFRSPIGNGQH